MSSPPTSDPDRDLVLACQADPTQGFDGPFRDLYECYKDRVYSTCYRVTGNAADALDASQETFGLIHRRLGGFRFESKFSSWVYRIAVNASIDHMRRQRLRTFQSLDGIQRAALDAGGSSPMDLPDHSAEDPMRVASQQELEGEIQGAIDRLSPKYRAVVVLRYLQSQTYEEISEALKISPGTVKSRLSRAHAALDRELTPVIDRHFT